MVPNGPENAPKKSQQKNTKITEIGEMYTTHYSSVVYFIWYCHKSRPGPPRLDTYIPAITIIGHRHSRYQLGQLRYPE